MAQPQVIGKHCDLIIARDHDHATQILREKFGAVYDSRGFHNQHSQYIGRDGYCPWIPFPDYRGGPILSDQLVTFYRPTSVIPKELVSRHMHSVPFEQLQARIIYTHGRTDEEIRKLIAADTFYSRAGSSIVTSPYSAPMQPRPRFSGIKSLL